MNGSDYKDASELQVVTLENAIYLSMKNDVAYVLHDELFLYEQQSTKNANMPLRCLFYASDTYSVLVKDKNIYGTKMLPPPSPTFVVFYNGKQTIRECMEEDVMADFLKRNRAEVVKMCLYEYDEEKQREFDREEGREEGREEERQNTLREKACADEAFRKIAILEKQLAELMK